MFAHGSIYHLTLLSCLSTIYLFISRKKNVFLPWRLLSLYQICNCGADWQIGVCFGIWLQRRCKHGLDSLGRLFPLRSTIRQLIPPPPYWFWLCLLQTHLLGSRVTWLRLARLHLMRSSLTRSCLPRLRLPQSRILGSCIEFNNQPENIKHDQKQCLTIVPIFSQSVVMY